MEKTVLVETSARHAHISKEHLEILFGEGYELTKKRIYHSLVSTLVKKESQLSDLKVSSLAFQSSVL